MLWKIYEKQYEYENEEGDDAVEDFSNMGKYLPKTGEIRKALRGEHKIFGEPIFHKNVNGTLVGIGIIIESNYSYFGNIPFLMVYVRSGYRSKGFAGEIIKKLVDYLVKNWEFDRYEVVFGASNVFRKYVESVGLDFKLESFAIPDPFPVGTFSRYL